MEADAIAGLADLTEPAQVEAYLRANSGLPGPRSNLALAHAAGARRDEAELRGWLAAAAGNADPTDEYLVLCAVVGIGTLVADGRADLAPELAVFAADQRWRVREAVVLALQVVGDADLERMQHVIGPWRYEEPTLVRAAVAAACEPRLLTAPGAVAWALDLLDDATEVLVRLGPTTPRDVGARVLRLALGYCWSVAVAADPRLAAPRLERWAADPNPDVRWVLHTNLGKKRIGAAGSSWVARMRDIVDRASS